MERSTLLTDYELWEQELADAPAATGLTRGEWLAVGASWVAGLVVLGWSLTPWLP